MYAKQAILWSIIHVPYTIYHQIVQLLTVYLVMVVQMYVQVVWKGMYYLMALVYVIYRIV